MESEKNGVKRHGCHIYERRIGVFNIQPVWKFKYHIEIGQKRCLPSKTKESI